MSAKKSAPPRVGLTKEQIDEFEIVENQLQRFREELSLLAKGKPNDSINGFKLKLLNALLRRANTVLGTQYVAVAGFDAFIDEDLPSSSDAVLVVSQHLGALEKLRADHIVQDYSSWYWRIGGRVSTIVAAPPAKLVK